MVKKNTLMIVVLCGMLGVMLFACAPKAPAPSTEKLSSTEGQPTAAARLDASSMDSIYESMNALGEQNAPKIIDNGDGTQSQITPDSNGGRVWKGFTGAYNTLVLDGDNRGCESCHANGLSEVIDNLSIYPHWTLDNGLGTVIDVRDCLFCHDVTPANLPRNGTSGYFGDVIHGIHEANGSLDDCMKCHITSTSGGMELWGVTKYNHLSGITAIENVQGDFSYEQDKLGGSVELTYWPHQEDEWVAKGLEGNESDLSEYDTWEITVSGMVDNPYSITVADLIAEAPMETVVGGNSCVVNYAGGELLGNVEAKGVPVSWLLEKAGVQANAGGVKPVGADGSGWTTFGWDEIERDGAWIITEINGEPLSYLEGFPVRYWNPDNGVPASVRWLTELVVEEEPSLKSCNGFGIADLDGSTGQWDQTGTEYENSGYEYYNKPNSGICNIHEGLIIKAGEPYTFEGFATAYDEQVIAVEFSMDRGKTWTRFDTSDSDPKKWVYWNFVFTPEEPGAHVLSVQAVSQTPDGGERRAPVYDEVLINVK